MTTADLGFPVLVFILFFWFFFALFGFSMTLRKGSRGEIKDFIHKVTNTNSEHKMKP